jgi:hypothetical protein
LKTATQLGIEIIRDKNDAVAGFTERTPSLLTLVKRYLDEGELTYRYLSAYAHSRRWALLPTSKAVATDDPLMANVSTAIDVSLFVDIATVHVGVFDECIGLWVRLAGYPKEVWELARQRSLQE